jgi:shikimate 5-dehydrogenase
VISGVEMLIWQAIEQVKLLSSAAGMTGEIDRSALYSVMKEAVSLK